MTKSRNTKMTVARGGTRLSNETQGKRALLFNEVMAADTNKNVFDLSHNVTMSGKMGHLMPLNIIKCVPGDIHKIGNESFIRIAPMIAPPMHQMNFSIHNWFVPSRLLWDNFEDYIIGKTPLNPAPYVTIDDSISGDQAKLMDYLGIPPCPTGGTPTQVSALPLAAYQFIYNEKYRDQNLISEVNYALTNGDNTTNGELFTIRNVAWEHDYYTSALPTASFGTTVDIPLGNPTINVGAILGSNAGFVDSTGNPVAGAANNVISQDVPAETLVAGTQVAWNPDGTLNMEATSIKELRQALKKQEFLELLARGGKRYYEVMQAMWNVNTSDERFQQPEWINGIKTPIIVSEVLNTTGTATAPQGNMAGHGISLGQDDGRSFFCEEYGYIVSVCFATPKSGYCQGIPKHYLELDHYEYGNFIQFEHIGEQEVQNNELYAYTATGEDVFGYVPRYAHLKVIPDRIAGDMRTTLDHWTMNRMFSSQPALNASFVEVDPNDPNITRIFAVEDESDYLYIDVWNSIRSVRPFSVFGNPQL